MKTTIKTPHLKKSKVWIVDFLISSADPSPPSPLPSPFGLFPLFVICFVLRLPLDCLLLDVVLLKILIGNWGGPIFFWGTSSCLLYFYDPSSSLPSSAFRSFYVFMNLFNYHRTVISESLIRQKGAKASINEYWNSL